MKSLRLLIIAAFLTSLSLSTGCVFVSGTKRAPASAAEEPTLGQQLIDLRKAQEAGALTEEEYQTQKSRLLK